MFRIVFILVLLLNLFNLNAQKLNRTTKIDTIYIQEDSVFVHVKDYKNDTLEYEYKGFSSIDSIKLDKFPKLPGDFKHLFKVKRRVNKIIIEGDYIHYTNQGKEVYRFLNRQFIYHKYFDKNGKEIDSYEYHGGDIVFNCTNFTGVIHMFYR